jgi:hypothetical protein
MKKAPPSEIGRGPEQELEVNTIAEPIVLHQPTPAAKRQLRRPIAMPVILPAMAELNALLLKLKVTQAVMSRALDVTAGHLSRCLRGERQLAPGKRLMMHALLLNYQKPTTPVMPAPTITITATERSVPELLGRTRAIAGGSDAPTRVSREQLAALVDHFNAKRL